MRRRAARAPLGALLTLPHQNSADYEKGQEIGTHTMTHTTGSGSSASEFREEIRGCRLALSVLGRVPEEEIVGFRAPFLQYNTASMDALYTSGMLYDSSIGEFAGGSAFSGTDINNKIYPYSYDYGSGTDCEFADRDCIAEWRYPSLWSVPMWSVDNPNGTPITLMDNYGVQELKDSLTRRLNGNRHPLGVFLHAGRTDPAVLNEFVTWADAIPGVYFVTNRQLIEWMRDPDAPGLDGDLASYFGCNDEGTATGYQPRPAPPCGTTTQCLVDGQYFAVCGSVCPAEYPRPSNYLSTLCGLDQGASCDEGTGDGCLCGDVGDGTVDDDYDPDGGGGGGGSQPYNCDAATGVCDSSCWPGTSGPCMSLDAKVCWNYLTTGVCPQGTVECCPPGSTSQDDDVPPPPDSDCVVSLWGPFSSCSADCGGGLKERTRTVLMPPIGDGAACPSLVDTQPCNTHQCSSDCVVSTWSSYSQCSEDCGGGVQHRTRTVVTEPENGGDSCPALYEERACNTHACETACQVGEWSDYGECSVECGGGTKQRTREVTVPATGDGQTCPPLTEVDTCNLHECDASSCSDGLLNGAESDVDCGGRHCGPCLTGQSCTSGADCVSGHCNDSQCTDATCSDGVQNGGETGVDCGDFACSTACADGVRCVGTEDCSATSSCISGYCTPDTCFNGIEDGGETGVDCGGFCPATCSDTGPGPVCGDDECDATESCNSCPNDCGTCPSGCGDGWCSAGYETCSNCPLDCGPCQPRGIVTSCQNPLHYALTFDDGPSWATSGLLDILQAEDVLATFFVVGYRCEHPDWKPFLQRAFADGHFIATHSYSHPHLTWLSDDQIRGELESTEAAIRDAICMRPRIFRPPFGESDARVRDVIEDLGYLIVEWNADTFDWMYAEDAPQTVLNNVQQALDEHHPGSIIHLQHDLLFESVALVPAIIDMVRQRGYQLVTLDECVYGADGSDSLDFQMQECDGNGGGGTPTDDADDGGTDDATNDATDDPGTGSTDDSVSSEDIDCAVSSWSSWGSCSAACGTGTQSRTRTVTTQPSGNGASCPGLTDTRSCNTHACSGGGGACSGCWPGTSGTCKGPDTVCWNYYPGTALCPGGTTACTGDGPPPPPPVDCEVSPWSAWDDCSASCGGGFQYRYRTVAVQPENGGNSCPPLSSSRACNPDACDTGSSSDGGVDMDCEVSGWSSWGSCSVDCGDGTRSRTRNVVVQSSGAGEACPALVETEPCIASTCPVDCQTSSWSSWSSCSEECGGGTRSRTRSVTVSPQNGGQACGALTQSAGCNEQECSGGGGGSQCSSCWPGTSGPCRSANTVCWGYYPGTTVCPSGSFPCASASFAQADSPHVDAILSVASIITSADIESHKASLVAGIASAVGLTPSHIVIQSFEEYGSGSAGGRARQLRGLGGFDVKFRIVSGENAPLPTPPPAEVARRLNVVSGSQTLSLSLAVAGLHAAPQGSHVDVVATVDNVALEESTGGVVDVDVDGGGGAARLSDDDAPVQGGTGGDGAANGDGDGLLEKLRSPVAVAVFAGVVVLAVVSAAVAVTMRRKHAGRVNAITKVSPASPAAGAAGAPSKRQGRRGRRRSRGNTAASGAPKEDAVRGAASASAVSPPAQARQVW